MELDVLFAYVADGSEVKAFHFGVEYAALNEDREKLPGLWIAQRKQYALQRVEDF